MTVRRVAGDAAVLVGSAYIAQLITFVMAILLRRELGPEGMGLVVVAQLALAYAPYVGLGSLQAAEREIALALGRDDEDRAVALETTASLMALGIAALAGAVAIALAVASAVQNASDEAALLASIGTVLISQQYAIRATVRMRTRNRFSTLGWVSAAGTVALAGLTMAGAFVGSTGGALIGLALGSVFQAAIYGYMARLPPWRRPTKRVGTHLARLSPAFLALGLTAAAISTIDQVAVGAILGPTALGLYSTAYLGNTFVLRIPTLINAVLYPRLQWRLGATASKGEVYGLTRRATVLTALFIPIPVAGFVIALPPAVWYVLPEFAAAIPAMRLLLVGVMGFAWGIPALHFAVTLNRQWAVILLTMVAVAAMGLAYGALSTLGAMSVETAAAVDAVAYFAYGLALQVLAARISAVPIKPLIMLWFGSALIGLQLLVTGIGVGPGPRDEPNWGSAVLVQAVAFGILWTFNALLILRTDPQARRDAAVVLQPLVQWCRRP